MYITNYRHDFRDKILIQFETSDNNGKCYTIDNIPDDALFEEFDRMKRYTGYNGEFYLATDDFFKRCSKLSRSYVISDENGLKGFLIIFNCLDMLMFDDTEANTYIPGDSIELNDLENVISVDYDHFKIYEGNDMYNNIIKPFSQEVKNYLKMK